MNRIEYLEKEIKRLTHKYKNCGFTQLDYSRRKLKGYSVVLSNSKHPLYSINHTCGIHIHICRACIRRRQSSVKLQLLKQELKIRKEYEPN